MMMMMIKIEASSFVLPFSLFFSAQSAAAEGHDATDITFSSGQLALISQVAAAARKPVIVVTFTAVPLDLTPLLMNNKIGAILHVGHPSVTTPGIGDILFGRKVPAGRTIQTILPASYQVRRKNHVPLIRDELFLCLPACFLIFSSLLCFGCRCCGIGQ